MHILGDATLRITKNSSNRYTDKQISVGILDSGRRQVQVTGSVLPITTTTQRLRTTKPLILCCGTCYFTVSSSQWQKIPYSISIQAIRFKDIQGEVLLTMVPTVLCNCQAAWPCTVDEWNENHYSYQRTAQATGHILLSNGSRGALVTPEGIALMRDMTTGRLKETHKISSVASLTGVNVATLSSEPPSYGGY